MFLFVLGTVAALAALGLLGYGATHPTRVDRHGDTIGLSRGVALGTGIAAAVVAIGLIVGSTFTVVDARALGIQTSMGRYRGTLPSGWHNVAPWSDVEQWTTRSQTIRFEGDGKQEDRENFDYEKLMTPRLGNQSDAYVEATIAWTISTDEANAATKIKDLWQQYKTFGEMQQGFIVQTVKDSVNTAFDGYNPLAGIVAQAEGKPVDPTYVPLAEWTTKVTGLLAPKLAARGIVLISATVTRVTFDQKTEGKLIEYNNEIANTRIAAQKVETAKKEAEASAARRNGVSNDCASIIRDLAATDQLKNLPPGVNVCGGTGSPVIVGQK